MEMISIKQFSCWTRQKLGNSRCQTGNFWRATKLRDKVAQLCCVSDMGLSLWMNTCYESAGTVSASQCLAGRPSGWFSEKDTLEIQSNPRWTWNPKTTERSHRPGFK